ncbi:MAG: translation initiation factor IF-2 [Actinomycetota bacterium]|nr:MAG: translation initiation factor IF-2 [Actinomycetota bacterium]
MAKRIRVYELAKELGLTNKEALDLCIALGIGVKSHSSSIEDAQADRARRKAEREGMVRAEQPQEEPVAQPKKQESPSASQPRTPQSVTAIPETPVPAKAESRIAESVPQQRRPIPERPTTTAAAPQQPRPSAAGATSQGRRSAGTTEARSAQAPTSQAPRAAQRSDPQRSEKDRPERTRPNDRAADQRSTNGIVSPAAGSGSGTSREPGKAVRAPMSSSGRPIPPPPGGPPRSLSGRPIPPPPGGGRGAGQQRQGDAERPRPAQPRSQGTGQNRESFSRQSSGQTGSRPNNFPPRQGGVHRPGGTGVPRGGQGAGQAPRPGQGGSDRTFVPRTGSGFPPRQGGGGFSGNRTAGAGAPAGASSPPRQGGGGYSSRGSGAVPPPPVSTRGAPGRGRPAQKQSKKRRRRNMEELEPTQLTAYVASNAPVPTGEVIVERGSSAQEVGPKLNRTAGDVVRFLFLQGEVVTATQSLSDDMIELFAAELGASVKLVDAGQEQEAELVAKYFDYTEEDAQYELELRPPIVTVMGHVDHGKTKLLDRIREANVVAGEAGGITQHIGAYQAEVNGRYVTFIDTPGHEAFTAMRARGAQVTDIVVLVVAADDGVMPQTIEAINHAKAAGVPIVVAINKIDRDNADPVRVQQQLAELGLVPEAWGGDTIMVEISALQNFGITELLEQIAVLAEVMELSSTPKGRSRGVVLEANLDVGRGPVATVIVLRGTLKVGDPIVAGPAWGRVKALIDYLGNNVKEAGPSMPVQVLGFSEVPSAGDEFRETNDLATARMIGEARAQRLRMAGYANLAAATPGAKLEDLFEQIQRGETATLNLIIKADVQGSLEAIVESLRKLERPEVKLAFIHKAVGGITENDVGLATASNATIIGFNVRPDRRARELAEANDVEIRNYEIIYKVIEDIESAMVGMLAPEYEEVVTGDAEVREVFRVPRVGAVAGCYVRNGVITRGSKVRFLRDGVIIWKGTITSLRRFKEDAREVQSGFECGIGLSDFQDLRAGDIIETFEDREIPRS